MRWVSQQILYASSTWYANQSFGPSSARVFDMTPRSLQEYNVVGFASHQLLCALSMVPTLVHLPNGQTLTVSPVFAGLSFKSNDLNVHHSVFPPGWTIIIESEELEAGSDSDEEANVYRRKKSHVHRYRSPTLHNDNLFISSISNPSNVDFKPATSPTRQIAMMLWATLWWYYHQVIPGLDV